MSEKEPIVFVRTGEFRKATPREFWEHRLAPSSIGYGETAVEHHILRVLKPGWLAEAVERAAGRVHRLLLSSGDWRVSKEAIAASLRAALFPDPEPEPLEWEREAATTWFRIPAEKRDAAALADHFAKARREAEARRV